MPAAAAAAPAAAAPPAAAPAAAPPLPPSAAASMAAVMPPARMAACPALSAAAARSSRTTERCAVQRVCRHASQLRRGCAGTEGLLWGPCRASAAWHTAKSPHLDQMPVSAHLALGQCRTAAPPTKDIIVLHACYAVQPSSATHALVHAPGTASASCRTAAPPARCCRTA